MSDLEPSMAGDLPRELRFALAEGDAVEAPDGLRQRVLVAASAERAPGGSVVATEAITGAEAYARVVARLDALLAELTEDDWRRNTIRDLDVQGLVGHLIGVEETFLAVLSGREDPSVGAGHVASTQPAAVRQAGQSAQATHREWRDRTAASIEALSGRDLAAPLAFYGTTMPLDQLLDTRAFEMWTHDEDVRRATGRPLADPDPGSLARMVRLAITLLPTGVALSGRMRPDATARVVLTGPGGGTWDVNLDGSTAARRADARVVVDAAWFCRVVSDREDAASAGALLDGAVDVAEDLLVGAAALALD